MTKSKNLSEVNLSEIQAELQYIVKSSEKPDSLLGLIVEKPPISILERIKIYQDAYLIRLSESIEEDFPEVNQKLGDTQFQNLVLEFISKNPSKTKNLAEYSKDFPEYLKNYSDELFQIATLEWMKIQTDLAVQLNEDSIISVEEIQNGHPFLIKLHPSVCYQRILEKYFLTYIHRNQVELRELSPSDFQLLTVFSQGLKTEDLMSSCDQLKMTEESVGRSLNQWLEKSILYCERI